MSRQSWNNVSDVFSREDRSPYVAGLVERGILLLSPPYSDERVSRWNWLLDPVLSDRASLPRAYVNAEELMSLGILEELFSPAMRSIIRGIMPDAILFHCHVYEIASRQTTSHIQQGVNKGWHRDEECVPYLTPGQYHHVSIFVYLSVVGEEDGPFEFALQPPMCAARDGTPSLRVLGRTGTTFIWNRAFRHRACPNRGPRRRRVLKLSIQNAPLPNERLGLPDFIAVERRYHNADPFLACLFGRSHGARASNGELPGVAPLELPKALPVVANDQVSVGTLGLLKMNIVSPLLQRTKEWLAFGRLDG